MYFVYLLECADGSIYTGITTNVERRLKEHQGGKAGARFTRAKKAKRMLYTEEHGNRSMALKREAQIKKWPRSEKLTLALGKRATVLKRMANNGWKTCSRGHKYRGKGPCTPCWPGRRKK